MDCIALLCNKCFCIVPGNISELSIQSSESQNNRISLTVTWSGPQSDVPITRYEGNYRTLPLGNWSRTFSNATRQHIYRNLLTGRNYEVRVRAVSAIGNGMYAKATTSRQLCITMSYTKLDLAL